MVTSNTAKTTTSGAAQALRATANRSTTPHSSYFQQYIGSNWAPRSEDAHSAREQAPYAAERRDRLSQLYPGKRLVIPAGSLKQRSNDTDYPFRAHSAFAYLTGWGSDSEPGSVLIFEPESNGHNATVYFRERAGRDSDEFYANPEIGEFWIGARPSLAQVSDDLDLATRGIGEVDALLNGTDENTIIIREADPALTTAVDANRSTLNQDQLAASIDADEACARDLSEMRLVKDDYELDQLRLAIAATSRGFDDIIRDFSRIVSHERGERLVEGIFNSRARSDGNSVGYDTIAASGPNACILHWTRNNGPVIPGDLILIDAGVEAESYYTADITRTLPASGQFSVVQRSVYEAVREAADSAFAIVKPGIAFREIHERAMAVIAHYTAQWGMLPVSAEEAIKPENQQHRRYMVHGTSHHLGLDVHDCAGARREMYLDGILEPGMTFTIEPGLYFQPDDLTVPEEYRGIGVRIEDNILVTKDGAENLSIEIPRTANDVEQWIAKLRG